MERIYITGPIARVLRRLARRRIGVRLEPSCCTTIEPLSQKKVTRASLGLDDALQSLGLRDDHAIDLLVPSARDRIRAKGTRSHVCAVPLPTHSFDLVLPAENAPLALPRNVEMFIDSASLSFAFAARRLGKAVTAKRLTDNCARLHLFKLGVEECATYSLDPWNPAAGSCVFDIQQSVSADALRQYLSQLHRFEGATRAQEVALWVFDRSASPMETFVNAAFALPPNVGSLSLGRPVANKVIPLSQLQHMMLNHIDHITPDLLWESVRIVLEYLGSEPHGGPTAQHEDAGRIQDYQALGYLVFPVLYAHVHAPSELNRLAMRIATAMDERGARGMADWVSELLADNDFLARQRELFSIMLPAVRDR